MSTINHFESRLAAELYAQGRPYFHEIVMNLVAKRLELTEPVAAALDVGCGTGLSTRALRRIARYVVGVDVSAEMIAQAELVEGITYRVGPAEALPVESDAFDLVTVSSAFHWLDRDRFFAEARRVLKPGGALVIYENGFQGAMREEPGFQDWVQMVHLAQYPSPPRQRRFQPDDGFPSYFTLLEGLPYENDVAMTAEQLVNYLLTQSNAIAVIESGRETLEQTRRFLSREIAPFYGAESGQSDIVTRHLQFRGVAWILKRDG